MNTGDDSTRQRPSEKTYQSCPNLEQVPQLGLVPSHRSFRFLQTTHAILLGLGTSPVLELVFACDGDDEVLPPALVPSFEWIEFGGEPDEYWAAAVRACSEVIIRLSECFFLRTPRSTKQASSRVIGRQLNLSLVERRLSLPRVVGPRRDPYLRRPKVRYSAVR